MFLGSDTDNSPNTIVRGDISLSTIGIITWIVFLVLKLCNVNNPDFSWLTWFWVWFPLWIVPAATVSFIIVIFFVSFIVFEITELVKKKKK